MSIHQVSILFYSKWIKFKELSIWLVLGLGAYHTGIEVESEEFSFANGIGIFSSIPKEAPGAIYKESIMMGEYQGNVYDVKRMIETLRPDFQGEMYDLLTK